MASDSAIDTVLSWFEIVAVGRVVVFPVALLVRGLSTRKSSLKPRLSMPGL
jgi:hypothetical protein